MRASPRLAVSHGRTMKGNVNLWNCQLGRYVCIVPASKLGRAQDQKNVVDRSKGAIAESSAIGSKSLRTYTNFGGDTSRPHGGTLSGV